MKSLIDRLNDSDPMTKGKAEVEWRALCKSNNVEPDAAYAEAMLLVAKRAKTDVTKRSNVSFADIMLAPVEKAKAAYDSDDDSKDDDEDEADDADNAKGKAKGAKPRLVAYDKNKDGDDADADDMVDDKPRHPETGQTGQYLADESDSKGKAKVKTKSQPGHKSKVSRGVSFASLMPGSNHAVREFDIASMPDRQPRPADTTEDALGREYSDAVYERLGGGLTGMDGDDDAIPSAGAGESFEGDTRTTGNAGAKFMASGEGNKGRVGGEDRGVKAIDPMLGAGASGSYTRDEIGQLDSIAVRVGEFTVMAPRDPGIAPAAQAQFPDSKATTLKTVRKGLKPGFFRSAIVGPEGGASDGQD